MREIKFRVWDKTKNKMIYDLECLTYDGSICAWDLLAGKYKSLAALQYTGLKDKNGEEIYEGDIIKHKYPPDEDWQTIFLVSFGEGTFDGGFYEFIGWHGWYDHSATDLIDTQNIEVIGNIYENSELLG